MGENSGLRVEEEEKVEVTGSQGLTIEQSVGQNDLIEDTGRSEGPGSTQPLPQPNVVEPLSDFRADSKQWRS